MNYSLSNCTNANYNSFLFQPKLKFLYKKKKPDEVYSGVLK